MIISKFNHKTVTRNVIVLVASSALTAIDAHGGGVLLHTATASYSQSSYPVGAAIDGITNDSTGWAIDGGTGQNQVAVFELASPQNSAGGFDLTFSLSQSFFFDHFSIGRFRISITGDDTSTFADGLSTGGDTSATWEVLTPYSYNASGGVTLALLGDSSLLASGATPTATTYTFSAVTGASVITGVRLEVLTDASLPNGGPGRASGTGNFVLSEFSMAATAIPEPSTAAILAGCAVLALGASRRKRCAHPAV